MPNDIPDPKRAAQALARATAEARRWARLAKLAGDREDRAFAEAQAASYYSQAARWEAQASAREATR